MRHGQQRPYIEPDMSTRVITVEANYQSLAAEVQNLSKRVDAYAQQTSQAVRDLAEGSARSVKELADRLSESRQTPWSTLAGWATVAVMLAGTGFSMMRSTEATLNAHLQQPGHTAALHYIELLEKRLERLERSRAEWNADALGR